jgi:copper transporter 1
MCNMNMLFTWDTNNLCIIFRQWHVRGPVSLIVSLLAIVAIGAGYEFIRDRIRAYDAWTLKRQETAPSNGQAERNVDENTPLRAGLSSQTGQGDRAHLIKAILYGFQNFYAFMIMLLFMTYNGWVMIAVSVGAAVGYWFFGHNTKATKETACH